jgi:hypothetical protein
VNATDKIITALTPGSIFNRNGKVFRSISSLAQFAGLEEAEVLELLNGDLTDVVTCKPSKKGKGILVALTAQIPGPEVILADLDQPLEPVAVVAGPVAPGLGIEFDNLDEEPEAGPLDNVPIAEAEEVVDEDFPPQE